MAQFYNYKTKKSYEELDFSCKKCDWSGTGKEASEGDGFSDGFPILCPKCRAYIEWIDVMVSHEDIMTYGSEEQKARELKRIAFINRIRTTELRSPDQLPDIDADEIIITLQEIESTEADSDDYIVLYWNEQELWRGIRSFEYYDRYLAFGEILKEKYGKRLIDFEAELTVYLGGDSLSAFRKVREFRKSLANKGE